MGNTILATITSDAPSHTSYVATVDGKTPPTSNWLKFDSPHPANDGYLVINHPGHNYLLCTRPEWQDEEYRQAYMVASIEQGVAWQIKINRKQRNWSQRQLASKIKTHQSAVARLEDPEYGGQTLDTLKKVAIAFDCALLVKFIPYSTLAREAQKLSPHDLYAESYTSEIKEGNHDFQK